MPAVVTRRTTSPWWLTEMYVALVVAGLSLIVLLLQDVVSALEPEDGELHHLFIFDLAWPVFLVSGLITLLAGLAALAVGRARADPRLTRFGVWSLGFVVVAVSAIVIIESAQSPPTSHTG